MLPPTTRRGCALLRSRQRMYAGQIVEAGTTEQVRRAHATPTPSDLRSVPQLDQDPPVVLNQPRQPTQSRTRPLISSIRVRLPSTVVELRCRQWATETGHVSRCWANE